MKIKKKIRINKQVSITCLKSKQFGRDKVSKVKVETGQVERELEYVQQKP